MSEKCTDVFSSWNENKRRALAKAHLKNKINDSNDAICSNVSKMIATESSRFIKEINDNLDMFKNKYKKYDNNTIDRFTYEKLGEFFIKAIPNVSSERKYTISEFSKETKEFKQLENDAKKYKCPVEDLINQDYMHDHNVKFVAVAGKISYAVMNGSRMAIEPLRNDMLLWGLSEQHLPMIPSQLKKDCATDLYGIKKAYFEDTKDILDVSFNVDIPITKILYSLVQIDEVANTSNRNSNELEKFKQFIPIKSTPHKVNRIQMLTNDSFAYKKMLEGSTCTTPHILTLLWEDDRIVDAFMLTVNECALPLSKVPFDNGQLEELIQKSGLFYKGVSLKSYSSYVDYDNVLSYGMTMDSHKALDVPEVQRVIQTFYTAHVNLNKRAISFIEKYQGMVFANEL